MVRFFEIVWSGDLDERFVGSHPYELPRFECPTCGSDHEATVSFPWVDGTKVFDSKTLRLMVSGKEPKGYRVESYRSHSATLQKVVGKHSLIPPGTYFGKFVGKVRRPPKDFDYGMTLSHMLFTNRSVFQELNELGFGLQAFDLELKKKEDSEKYVELWAPVVGMAANMEICSECNRSPDKISRILKANSIPEEAHFFRLKNWPNYFVMSEVLVNRIVKLGLTGLKFRELSVE